MMSRIIGSVLFLSTVSLFFVTTSLSASGQGEDPLFNKSRVHEFYFTFEQEDWWGELQRSYNTGEDVEGDLVHDGVLYPSIGLRVKGFSSAQVPGRKKPFNLSMDSFIDTQRLLGYRTVNLNNAFVDPTYTREVLCYEMYGEYMPAPQTAYARVYLNGDYWGLYVMVEQPNKDFVQRHYRDGSGVRYKGDDPTGVRLNSSTLQYFGDDPAEYADNYEIKNPDHPDAWTTFIEALDALNNSSDEEFAEIIEPFVNVDRALWYMAVGNVVHNMDSYVGGAHNFYVYMNPVGDRLEMTPWDCNLSFGGFLGGRNAWRLDPNYRRRVNNRPLKKRLLDEPIYQGVFYSHIRTITEEIFSWDDHLGPLNTQYQELVRQAVEEDPYKLYGMDEFDRGVYDELNLNGWVVPGLKPHVDKRRGFLLAHEDIRVPPSISDVLVEPLDARVGETIHVTARVTAVPMSEVSRTSTSYPTVTLRVSTEGPFDRIPMFDDGAHGDGLAGDGLYGASFTVDEIADEYRVYVTATGTDGAFSSSPPRAEYETYSVSVRHGPPSGSVVLNELLASNDQGDSDEAGDNDDWVEILNIGDQPFDLTGHHLSDDFFNRDKWQFPDGTVLSPGEVLRVWCDDEEGEGPFHASFKLSKDGERVGLFGPDESSHEMLDAVVFGAQEVDRSYGRIPDGGDDWYFIWQPSGGAPGYGTGRDFMAYDQRRDASPDGFELHFNGSVIAGELASLDLLYGPSLSNALLWVSFAPGYSTLDSLGPVSIDLSSMVCITVPLDLFGNASLPFTVPDNLGHIVLYAQAATTSTSNALAIRFLP